MNAFVNKLSFKARYNVVLDIETAIDYCRRFGKVVSIGHSLGGRLSLISGSDFSIGLSPAIYKTICKQTQENVELFKSHRLREVVSVSEMFDRLPEWDLDKNKPKLIIYGSHDSQDIIIACNEITDPSFPIIQIEKALHGDTFLLEESWGHIEKYLKEWCSEEMA